MVIDSRASSKPAPRTALESWATRAGPSMKVPGRTDWLTVKEPSPTQAVGNSRELGNRGIPTGREFSSSVVRKNTKRNLTKGDESAGPGVKSIFRGPKYDMTGTTMTRPALGM